MKELLNIKKQTNNNFLNLYELTYKNNKKSYAYYMVSRKNEEELSCKGICKVDAVRAVPYFYKKNEMFVVLIKEFRHPLNKYIFSVPAGLVDENETLEQAIVREINEEIGAQTINLICTQKPSFVSAGLSDELIACFEAEVIFCGKQNLDTNEDIEIKIVNFLELEDFLENNEFGLQSALLLKSFLYKIKLKSLLGK